MSHGATKFNSNIFNNLRLLLKVTLYAWTTLMNIAPFPVKPFVYKELEADLNYLLQPVFIHFCDNPKTIATSKFPVPSLPFLNVQYCQLHAEAYVLSH